METIRCAFRLCEQGEYKGGFLVKVLENGDVLCCNMEGKLVPVKYNNIILEIEDLEEKWKINNC